MDRLIVVVAPRLQLQLQQDQASFLHQLLNFNGAQGAKPKESKEVSGRRGAGGDGGLAALWLQQTATTITTMQNVQLKLTVQFLYFLIVN